MPGESWPAAARRRRRRRRRCRRRSHPGYGWRAAVAAAAGKRGEAAAAGSRPGGPGRGREGTAGRCGACLSPGRRRIRVANLRLPAVDGTPASESAARPVGREPEVGDPFENAARRCGRRRGAAAVA